MRNPAVVAKHGLEAGAEIALLAMRANRCLRIAVEALKEVAFLGDPHSQRVATEAMRKIRAEMADVTHR